MRRVIFPGIFLILTCLAGGCMLQTENPLPVISPQPGISSESYGNSGGTALAVAFKTDQISTKSPQAKERFLNGLSLSTRYARYNESLEYFEEALAIDPGFSEAWVAKAVALHNMKRYAEAIGCYDTALELAPRDAGTWHLKGVTLHDYGMPEESADCYRKAAEIDPSYRTETGLPVTAKGMDYPNAPQITDEQKADALRIASSSVSDGTPSSASGMAPAPKKFGDFIRDPHGTISFAWSYPFSGDIHLSMPVGSPSSDEYGLAYADVDPDNGTIISEGFVDWHKHW
jgi:tetratricopeptide (TPR) repeat protein